MQSQDPSSDAIDQFSFDAAAFISETVPGTGIKLLRAKPETEPELSRQLHILHRLELLRRHSADPKPHPHPTPRLEDVPVSASDPTAIQFLQDVAEVGQTSAGETIYLILSATVSPTQWQGGWGLAVVPLEDSERFQTYLTGAREVIVAELQRQTETQP
jgi:hypothetical protein